MIFRFDGLRNERGNEDSQRVTRESQRMSRWHISGKEERKVMITTAK
jgi:hypothetical protein